MSIGNPDNWMYLDMDKEDLTPYRDMAHKHNIMTPLYYREALVEHFTGDPNTKGSALPWDCMNGLRIRPGEVTLIAGQNFAGKSALLTQCISQWIREDHKVLLISPEFSPELNLARVVQQVIGKSPRDIDEADVSAVLAFLESNFKVYDAIGSVDIDDLMAVCYYAAEEFGITMVAIDNLTVMKLPSADVNQAQGELMTSLVQTARQTGVHIHVVCHTRKPQQHEQVSRYNIRGASQLSDLADNILMVERNESKEKKLADINLDEEDRQLVRLQSDTRLHCLKQRHGSAWVGVGKLYFSPISMRWYESMKYVDRPFNEVVALAEVGGITATGTV